MAIGQNEPALGVDDEPGRLRRGVPLRIERPHAVDLNRDHAGGDALESVCAQFADRSTSSGGGETAGTAGDSAGTGAATAGGGVAVESEGPAQPCVESRTRDNQSELRDILGNCLK